MACVRVPPGNSDPQQLRLAYWSERPEVHRWVFVPTRLAGSLACTGRLRWATRYALLQPDP
jgi:hypothetical protein